MNKWIGTGNLVADPETRTANNGNIVCSFRIAVQRKFANAQGVREADFIPVVCFRQLADLCNKYLAKGRKVAVEGSIQTRSYDAQDGTKRFVTEVIADSVEFLGSNKENGQGNAPAQASGDGFAEVQDDELPF